MKVSGLDKTGDWRFGRGRAVYVQDSAAILQDVVTRLRSFRGDWFLDVRAHIAWIDLLGQPGSRDRILREVERVTLATDGVVRLTHLSMDYNRTDRRARILLGYEDIFNVTQSVNEAFEP